MGEYKELATAMREGLNGYEQCYGDMIKPSILGSILGTGNIVAVCALGAVYMSSAIERTPETWRDMELNDPAGLFRKFSILQDIHGFPEGLDSEPDDAFDTFEYNLSEVIMHLNDKQHWTIERIASWLDSLEEQ